jgi:hypothetical protein
MGLSFAKCPHCFFCFFLLLQLCWQLAAEIGASLRAKRFMWGGPKRRRSGEARVAKTSVVTAVAGLEMQPAAKCLVDFASDCKSL